MQYAVVDVETTGVYPGGHDRIVEIAVVRLDPHLETVSEFATLLNPNRDLGPSWLHGIRAADVQGAPSFPEVAGCVLDQLRDSLVVGHNVAFDLRFLEAEFLRDGIRIERPPHIDTMPMAVRLGSPTRRLEDACDLFGIAVPTHHSALADARAAAAVFRRCSEHEGYVMAQAPAVPSWPVLQARGKLWPRTDAAKRWRERVPFLANLVRDLPAVDGDPGDWHAYYAVLDRALEDRRISQDEQAALRQAALDAGLSGDDVRTANESYLRALVATALHDGILSESEEQDLREVARLVALESALPGMLERNRGTGSPSDETGASREFVGRTVCFTGAMSGFVDGDRVTRERARELAASKGMVVVSGVTKKLDYLVLADPDSMSSKAKKARRYGTRLIAEPAFWAMMGVSTGG